MGLTSREKYLKYRNKILVYQKEYYSKNKEKVLRQMAEWRKNNKDKNNSYKRAYLIRSNYVENNREKVVARRRVKYALDRGKLIKEPCIKCGNYKSYAHHYKGYEVPFWLTIRWLCWQHHKEAHA